MARWQAGGVPRSPHGDTAPARTGGSASRFARTVSAEPGQLAVVRRELRAWLASVGASDVLADDALIAVGEAVANAIEHAYAHPRRGAVEIEVVAGPERPGVLDVTVRDRGAWRPSTETAADQDRGRGIAMMRAVGSDLRYDRSAEGTTVRFCVGAPPDQSGSAAAPA